MMAEREGIDTGTDTRYVRRDEEGQFKESDDAPLANLGDRRKEAQHQTTKGQGDGGARKD
jgi:hypothetical protein